MEHQWNLCVQNYKNKKSIAEIGQNDLLSVYKSSFPEMPISQENMNAFWSDFITVAHELIFFIFMQMGYPRWPPGAITKNSKNIKMTIFQEPLVETDPALCKNVFCMKPF